MFTNLLIGRRTLFDFAWGIFQGGCYYVGVEPRFQYLNIWLCASGERMKDGLCMVMDMSFSYFINIVFFCCGLGKSAVKVMKRRGDRTIHVWWYLNFTVFKDRIC